jgi:hypothetical protein
LIFSCTVLCVSAQEKIFSDSIPTKHPELLTRQPVMEKSPIFDEASFQEEINSLNFSIFDQPLLPSYNKNLDFLKYLNSSKKISLPYSFSQTSFNPFLSFGQVYNQSAYRLNDRFVVGGNSFGTQSVFDPPKLNGTIQDMSIKGASLFLQYKVSDHFKVQTRVSVSNRPSSPWEP